MNLKPSTLEKSAYCLIAKSGIFTRFGLEPPESSASKSLFLGEFWLASLDELFR